MANMTDHPTQGRETQLGDPLVPGETIDYRVGGSHQVWYNQNQTPKTKPPKPNPELPLSKLPLLTLCIYDTKRAAAIPFPITLISVLRFASTSFFLS